MKRRNVLLISAGVATTSVLARKTQAIAAKQIAAGETVMLSPNLKGYYVHPVGNRPAPAVLVLMEAFGLNPYIRDVCDRLAKAGYAALAPDFYHGETYEYTDIQRAITKLKSLQDETVMAEVNKGLEFLATRKDVDGSKVGAIGFCMGGRLSFLTSSVYTKQIKAAVCFYGGGIAANPDPLGRKSLLDQVDAIQTPLLLLYGANDQSITPEEHERIVLALSTHKKRYTLSVFPNAGHGFFSDRRDSYAPAAAQEAWDMTLNFFSRNLK